MNSLTCRFCGNALENSFCDLGLSPLSNSFLSREELNHMEPFYPLHAYVCSKCLLVQVQEFQSPKEIFSEYEYFSSYSDTWLQHASHYVEYMIDRFHYSASKQVIEIASNDGYLLRYFKEKGIPVLGIEPALNIASIAESMGIPTVTEFFGSEIASKLRSQGTRADLLIGNNVLAHVPDLNDFVAGLKILLSEDGIITMEFPHLMRLIDGNQFDTIYHEHFSYFSLLTVEKVFDRHGLCIFDVEELSTHGGSLRIFAKHNDNDIALSMESLKLVKEAEIRKGMDQLPTYLQFGEGVKGAKRSLLQLLISLKGQGKSIVGYGAPAKGNTLLNYCGIMTDFLDYTVDRNPHKQGLFLPGTHIPIFPPDRIQQTRPDYVLILPWNLKEEIKGQVSFIREWGGKFITPIPLAEILP